VVPPLLDDRVGPLPHLGHDPVAGAAVRLGARHARPEVELRLDVAACGFAIERRPRGRFLSVARA
jgi:hypothetical protein